jgi:NAD(P)H-nitrite reductase large subunit
MEPENHIYRKIVLNERDEIVGAILLGKVGDIGLISQLIRNRVEIPREFRNDLVRAALKNGKYLSHKSLYRQLPFLERDTTRKIWE